MKEDQEYPNLFIHQRFFYFNQIFVFILVGVYPSQQLEVWIFTIENKGETIVPYYY